MPVEIQWHSKITIFKDVTSCCQAEIYWCWREPVTSISGSILTLEAAGPSKMLSYFYQTISCHIPEDSDCHSSHRRKLSNLPLKFNDINFLLLLSEINIRWNFNMYVFMYTEHPIKCCLFICMTVSSLTITTSSLVMNTTDRVVLSSF